MEAASAPAASAPTGSSLLVATGLVSQLQRSTRDLQLKHHSKLYDQRILL